MTDTTRPTMREHWQQAQGYLQVMTAPAAYDLWLAPLQPQSYQNGVLVLAAPNSVVRDRVAHRLDRIVRDALYFQTGREFVVEYVLAQAETGGAAC